jgi:tricorn protease
MIRRDHGDQHVLRQRNSAARAAIATLLFFVTVLAGGGAQARNGFYRYPAVHGDTVVFTSEGDLWSVDVHGGYARRLTSNSGIETKPVISPDGQTIAFVAQYEGPSDVYVMQAGGGVPQRRTWDGDSTPAAWAPDGRLLISTTRFSTLPDPKLVLLGNHGEREIVPLAGGSEAGYSSDGHTLFFTRWRKQPSYTKRYEGGMAESIWAFDGNGEATPLTADWRGTSHDPMFWSGRVYFLSDRDGVMNVWSMDAQGHDAKQESHQKLFDVLSASISDGHLVYSSGADLWSLDLKSGREAVIPITLISDFDQLRDHWVKRPLTFLSNVHISPDGTSAVFTARGAVFTLPAKSGRIVKVADASGVHYRDARFLPDGKNLVLLSTESGETEFWRYPANGEGPTEQLTHDAKVLRWEGIPSPDGHWLAHRDKDQVLWMYDLKLKRDKRIAQSSTNDFSDLQWSPDSRWLSYVQTAANQFDQIFILNVDSGETRAITSNRYNSGNAVWSPDGKWLYFLSDRALKTTVESPWGARQPDPHFARPMKIYELALAPGLRSPFLAPDELHPEAEPKASSPAADKDTHPAKESRAGKDAHAGVDAAKAPAKVSDVKIEFTDLIARVQEVPAPAGNYDSLQMTDKRLCWLNYADEPEPKAALQCLDIGNKGEELETIAGEVKGFEISADRKKLLLAREHEFFIFDADIKGPAVNDPKVAGKAQINLSHWTYATNPRAEFRGIFFDAWRLERDYFYDRNMVGVDWTAMRARYLPLVDRVSDREELNDVISQMVGELSTLHTFVHGGDARHPLDQIDVGALGARLRRDERAGGFVVEHIYLHDPDLPNEAPPFEQPESRVREGEVIVGIDGENALSAPDERAMLLGKAGTQVLLRVKSNAGETRDVLVTAMKVADESGLRYGEWEYTRRLEVEKESNGRIGYVHLRAMGAPDIEQWAREYYPVFDRQGLIIDVRHNRGGNIDSWLLGKLLRQAWFYWQPRVGDPAWNMQYAFRGHIVVLCDQATASDGEAFSEGFRRLKLGRIIGTRTWGGEVWLSSNNFEADGGIATAGEIGVFGPEGKWLIEGHGVDPDIVVDNLPHATYQGADAQLKAAIDLLQDEINKDPRPVPKAPPYPQKAFHN